MFDIGFWELAIVMVVALLVIGPERLPGVARKAGMWLGRTRRFIASVKADIDRELAAEELQRILKDQADSTPIHDIIETTRETAAEAEKAIRELAGTPAAGSSHADAAAPEADAGAGATAPEAAAMPKEPATGAAAEPVPDTGPGPGAAPAETPAGALPGQHGQRDEH